MFRCDIEELEADFSAIIAKVEAGATVTVYKDDEPFAEIRPIQTHIERVVFFEK
ncbi:MAG: hypothetical protein Q3M30_07325 [Candidatus Electrothrix sp. Rat3]|nr:hypothetical protein [Candidatus Electrothrix rattekaaiensis]